MKTVSLSGSLRKNVGKKDAKLQRKQGNIPSVLYGGEEQIHFSVDAKKFNKLIFTPEVFFINLNIDGKEFRVILQDVQYHPVTDNVLHADFLELTVGKHVVMGIPIKLEGTPQGILTGGRLINKIRKLKVKGLPKDIPDDIVLDISNLDIGDSIKVNEVKLDNIEILDSLRSVIVGVRVTRIVEEEVLTDEETSEEGEGEGEGEEGKEGEATGKTEEKPSK